MLLLWGVCTVNWRHTRMLLSVGHPPFLVTTHSCCYERLNCNDARTPTATPTCPCCYDIPIKLKK
jgi:hypothetical protein